jgi:hypothetical protein
MSCYLLHFHDDTGKTDKQLVFMHILAMAQSAVSRPFVFNNLLGSTGIFNIFLCEPVRLILIDKLPIRATRSEPPKEQAMPAQAIEAMEEDTISRKGAASEKAPGKPSRGSRRVSAPWRLRVLEFHEPHRSPDLGLCARRFVFSQLPSIGIGQTGSASVPTLVD